VLVADDQPAMRALLARTLRGAGYEVGDGDALWRELGDERGEPDLVVSDIHLPGVSGLEVLARLRQSDWMMPVILISAFADLATLPDANRQGVSRVLTKPFEMHDLVRTAQALVDPTPTPD
jgi:DNA-binding response OmpR family regulator